VFWSARYVHSLRGTQWQEKLFSAVYDFSHKAMILFFYTEMQAGDDI
jgi:hypothetical protein